MSLIVQVRMRIAELVSCAFCNSSYQKITSICKPCFSRGQWFDSLSELSPSLFLTWDRGAGREQRGQEVIKSVTAWCLKRNIESPFLWWAYFFCIFTYHLFCSMEKQFSLFSFSFPRSWTLTSVTSFGGLI